MTRAFLLPLLALASASSCSAANDDDPVPFRELSDLSAIDGGGDCDCKDCEGAGACWIFLHDDLAVLLTVYDLELLESAPKSAYIQIPTEQSRSVRAPLPDAYEIDESSDASRVYIRVSLMDGTLDPPPGTKLSVIQISNLDSGALEEVAEAVQDADVLNFGGIATLPHDR